MLYMVLNDGETYTDLEGCKIVYIDETVVAPHIENFEPQEDEVIKDIANGKISLPAFRVLAEFNTLFDNSSIALDFLAEHNKNTFRKTVIIK